MANSITGIITYISDIQNIETRNGQFQKREVWVAPMQFDRDSGEPTYGDATRSVSIEVTRNVVFELNQFKVGDEVVIPLRIRGNVYEKDGIKRCINTIEGIAVKQYQKGVQIVVSEEQQQQQPSVEHQYTPSQPTQSTQQTPTTSAQPKPDESLPF